MAWDPDLEQDFVFHAFQQRSDPFLHRLDARLQVMRAMIASKAEPRMASRFRPPELDCLGPCAWRAYIIAAGKFSQLFVTDQGGA
jgi:hypothetical protein